MSEYLSAAAEALGAPEAIVERSANARAQATGADPEEILKAWAGGEAAPAPTGTEAPAPPVEPEPEPERPTEPAPELEPVPTPTAAPGGAPVTPVPAPATVGPEEALDYPVVVSVPTVGLKERTASALPRWLATLFTIIPLFGLLYLAGNIGAEATACSEGGLTLAVDRVSGELRNCDGSPYEGRGGVGGAGSEFLAIGEETYATCAACHGPNGGGGVGPALASTISVFGSCADHVEWVQRGSAGFLAADRTTYGDIAKPVNGGMPGFGFSLTPEQLSSVVAFERIRFAGGDPSAVLADCGLTGGEDEGEGTEGIEAMGTAPGQ